MAYTTSRPTETIERLTRTAYYLNLELYRRRIGQIAPCIAIQWKGVCLLCYQLDMLCPQVRLFKAISSTAVRLLFDSASTAVRLLFDSASTAVRGCFETASGRLRLRFDSCSSPVRLLFDTSSGVLRLPVEEHPKNTRKTPEKSPGNLEASCGFQRTISE
ncbi:hypothetical protein [Sphingobacterium sp. FBM7-1]|uniref:hypothetical protein n=1 Tax=Sphingobacterium sp. FBM7-1 TaxID=2886688 RepID=UPI001D12D168|nr:hypothetical protein [Sphingobacterium sp. FBM7-1]MCC2598412.1 hypothetical protein [Sphingobacterium sp. FBM7-1]